MIIINTPQNPTDSGFCSSGLVWVTQICEELLGKHMVRSTQRHGQTQDHVTQGRPVSSSYLEAGPHTDIFLSLEPLGC